MKITLVLVGQLVWTLSAASRTNSEDEDDVVSSRKVEEHRHLQVMHLPGDFGGQHMNVTRTNETVHEEGGETVVDTMGPTATPSESPSDLPSIVPTPYPSISVFPTHAPSVYVQNPNNNEPTTSVPTTHYPTTTSPTITTSAPVVVTDEPTASPFLTEPVYSPVYSPIESPAVGSPPVAPSPVAPTMDPYTVGVQNTLGDMANTMGGMGNFGDGDMMNYGGGMTGATMNLNAGGGDGDSMNFFDGGMNFGDFAGAFSNPGGTDVGESSPYGGSFHFNLAGIPGFQ